MNCQCTLESDSRDKNPFSCFLPPPQPWKRNAWICRLSAFRPSVLQRKSCICEPQWLVRKSPITTSPSDSIAATKPTPVKQRLEMGPSGLQKWQIWGSRWDEWNEVEETPLRTAEVRQQNTTLRKQVCYLQRIKFPAFLIFALPWMFSFVSDFNFFFSLSSSLIKNFQADLLTRLPLKSHLHTQSDPGPATCRWMLRYRLSAS